MADSDPVWGSTTTPSSRPASQKSSRSINSSRSQRPSSQTTEATPLLAREESHQGDRGNDASVDALPLSPADHDAPDAKARKSRVRPSIIALLLLCVVAILIMVLGFFAPEAVQEYAMQAMVFEPTSLSVDSFTSTGVRARVQGDFSMDASRVKKKSVRDLGRFGTWVAKEVESGESHVQVYMPEYGNVVLGTAVVPRIKVNIRNGHTTHVDFLTDLEPGQTDGIKRIANDWLDGRLGQLRLQGKAKVPLRSGILRLGEQVISQSLVFQGDNLPTTPEYNITKMNIHEVDLQNGRKGVAADVALTVKNDYPVDLTIPPLGFEILVGNCRPTDPYVMLADAATGELHAELKQDIHLNVSGTVRRLPDELTAACPNSHKSPLDALLGNYIRGEDTTIYVRGSQSPSPETPHWITNLISGITVPVPVTGHTFGDLARNFSLADVHIYLPSFAAQPGTPEAQPRLSAKVKALIALPEEMNFPVSVSRMRAEADIHYHGKKLGNMDLRKWQKANSTRLEAHDDEEAGLAVESVVEKAPLHITDDDVFSELVQALMFGSKPLLLTIKLDVDVEMEAAFGKFTVRQIPAEGVFPVDMIPRGGFGALSPKVGNLQVVDTGVSSLTLQAEVNFTNPTDYSATVPYVDVHILINGTVLGHATIKDVTVVPGLNEGAIGQVTWEPLTAGGREGRAIGREFLSQFISGFNTSLTIRMHNGTIPAQPALGKALERFNFTMPAPSLGTPSDPGSPGDDPDHKGPQLIQDTTMHLLTSTAVFTLSSPFEHNTMYITHMNSSAFYKDANVGDINYDIPFAVPPGLSQSPRLPVDWSLGSIGYEAVRKALGGQLKLAAKATVGVKIGRWEETVWYKGGSIGVKVRL